MIRKFDSTDLVEMNTWYEDRGLPAVPRESLPAIGLIEPGVACLFIYQTDSCIAMLEGLVTNPKAPTQKRVAAIDELLDKGFALAKELGFTQVIGLTKDTGTFKRVQRSGFLDLGQYHMVAKRA